MYLYNNFFKYMIQIFFFLICSKFCHTLKWNGLEFTCLPHPVPPSHLPLQYYCRWVGMYIYKFSFQITVIGRYGSTNARAKIPLGFYYGHTYILPWESELKLMHDPLRGEGESANQPEIDQHLAMMVALQEDIQCRLVENWCIF